jgi:hypothetical protein
MFSKLDWAHGKSIIRVIFIGADEHIYKELAIF